MKRSVVLCGSQQKKEGLYRFYEELSRLSVACLKPDFEGRSLSFLQLEEQDRMKDAGYRQHLETFIRAHLERIRTSDICFIFNEDGKFGVNTRLEFDYARQYNKPIFSLLPLPARHQTFIESVVSTAQDLLPWLGDYVALVAEPYHAVELSRWSDALQRQGIIPLAITDLEPRSLHRLNIADAVFVFNPKGVVHEDVVALLGSAVAHAKPIYAYDKDPIEACCNTFFHPQQVTTPEGLIRMLYPSGNHGRIVQELPIAQTREG